MRFDQSAAVYPSTSGLPFLRSVSHLDCETVLLTLINNDYPLVVWMVYISKVWYSLQIFVSVKIKVAIKKVYMIIFCLSHFCFGGYGYKFWLLLVLQTLKLFLKIVCQAPLLPDFVWKCVTALQFYSKTRSSFIYT